MRGNMNVKRRCI